MKSYTVVKGDTLDQLIESVNEKINEGWIPTGGVSILSYGYSGYMQAMTKHL